MGVFPTDIHSEVLQTSDSDSALKVSFYKKQIQLCRIQVKSYTVL